MIVIPIQFRASTNNIYPIIFNLPVKKIDNFNFETFEQVLNQVKIFSKKDNTIHRMQLNIKTTEQPSRIATCTLIKI